MRKNIFVIGGTGFIGKNIFDINCNNHFNNLNINYYFLINNTILTNEGKNIFQIKGDFLNKSTLTEIFQYYKFDEVWHFLSTSVPGNSNDNINDSIEKELLSMLHLLNLMKEYQTSKLIYLSSGGAIYNSNINHQYQEDCIFNPKSSYGILKLAIENYIRLFNTLHGLNFRIYRLSNLFGKHHNSEANGFINILIRRAIANEAIEVWGDGTAQKDFMFASDFADIFWQLNATLSCDNSIINIGCGNFLSISEILNLMINKFPNLKIMYKNSALHDFSMTEFSIQKLKSHIKVPQTDMAVALETTITWEKNKIVREK
jgi:UDP-glucose 4-epimerase